MNETNKKEIEEALAPNAEPEKFIAKMEIVMLQDGYIGLKGPIKNKPLCKAMLAGAEVLIDEFKPQIMPARDFRFVPPGRG